MGAMKWIGGPGQFLAGIPARDLTAAEVKQHDAERLVASGLYEPADAPAEKSHGRKAEAGRRDAASSESSAQDTPDAASEEA